MIHRPINAALPPILPLPTPSLLFHPIYFLFPLSPWSSPKSKWVSLSEQPPPCVSPPSQPSAHWAWFLFTCVCSPWRYVLPEKGPMWLTCGLQCGFLAEAALKAATLIFLSSWPLKIDSKKPSWTCQTFPLEIVKYLWCNQEQKEREENQRRAKRILFCLHLDLRENRTAFPCC